MSDDAELITALRMRSESDLCREAADRIEALVKELAEYRMATGSVSKTDPTGNFPTPSMLILERRRP